MLHPDFPVVQGKLQMTEDWSIELPVPFNRRIEEGSLVFWRPGFTIWLSVWGNDRGESPEQRLRENAEDIAPDAYEVEQVRDGGVLRLGYRLKEEGEDGPVHTLHGFAFGTRGDVLMAIYFDDEADLARARRIWRSVEERPAP